MANSYNHQYTKAKIPELISKLSPSLLESQTQPAYSINFQLEIQMKFCEENSQTTIYPVEL